MTPPIKYDEPLWVASSIEPEKTRIRLKKIKQKKGKPMSEPKKKKRISLSDHKKCAYEPGGTYEDAK